MLETGKKAVIKAAINEVQRAIKEWGYHFRYFGQHALEGSLERDLFRLEKLLNGMDAAKPRKKFFLALVACAGLQKANEFSGKLFEILKDHQSITREVFEQIRLAKDQIIHPRIAEPLNMRLAEVYNRFADHANELMEFIEKRYPKYYEKA